VSLEVSGHGQSSYECKDESTAAATVDFFNREGAARVISDCHFSV
jgi:hypothetical protein